MKKFHFPSWELSIQCIWWSSRRSNCTRCSACEQRCLSSCSLCPGITVCVSLCLIVAGFAPSVCARFGPCFCLTPFQQCIAAESGPERGRLNRLGFQLHWGFSQASQLTITSLLLQLAASPSPESQIPPVCPPAKGPHTQGQLGKRAVPMRPLIRLHLFSHNPGLHPLFLSVVSTRAVGLTEWNCGGALETRVK